MNIEELEFLNILSNKAMGLRFVTIVAFSRQGEISLICTQSNPNLWQFPGGKIEEDENYIDAAKREFLEETGYKLHNSILVAKIKNITQNKELHSISYLITGFFEKEEIQSQLDKEIMSYSYFNELPKKTFFNKNWNLKLIEKSKKTLTTSMNEKMWNISSKFYDNDTLISEKDIHYGPLLAGENILKLLPQIKNKRVLDLGCGGGYNLAALQYKGATSGVGIDISEHHVKKAKNKLNNNFTIIQSDISQYSFENYPNFDIVLSIFSIQFIGNIKELIEKISRKMNINAHLIISTDHPLRIGKWKDSNLSIKNWFGTRIKIRKWEINNQQYNYIHHLHSVPELSSACINAGLQITKIIEPKPLEKKFQRDMPYKAKYFLDRYEELSSIPYTLIIVAKKENKENL